MADAVGIKWNAWARYERGDVSPGAEILTRICKIHACSADWLLGLKDSQSAVVDCEQGTPQKTPVVNLDDLRATATQLAEASAALAGTIKKLKKML